MYLFIAITPKSTLNRGGNTWVFLLLFESKTNVCLLVECEHCAVFILRPTNVRIWHKAVFKVGPVAGP